MSERQLEIRSYRAARLTRDEVLFLENHVPCRECGHLLVFHNHGETDEGRRWESCWICSCLKDEPPNALARLAHAQDAEYDRLRLRDRFVAGIGCGAGVAGLIRLLSWWLS